MKKKVLRAAIKTPPRKNRKIAAVEAMSADEVSHLEVLVKRFEDSEKAWQRMTMPPDEAESWTHVEEHLLKRPGDSDRRWKFFSK